MNTKTIIIFVAVILGLLGGVGALLTQFGQSSEDPIVDIAGEKKHVKGPSTSSGQGLVTLVEFSDFQCPACLSVQAPLEQILKKYEGKIEFIYRHFPLTTIHKNAQLASQAAEAAGLQDKFWQMHDKLFVAQSEWSALGDPKEKFVNYAAEIGLDKDKFVNQLESQEVKDMVAVDILAATRYRLTGTPTFFVNGIKTEFGQLEDRIAVLAK